jgi:hypothetical protein
MSSFSETCPRFVGWTRIRWSICFLALPALVSASGYSSSGAGACFSVRLFRNRRTGQMIKKGHPLFSRSFTFPGGISGVRGRSRSSR